MPVMAQTVTVKTQIAIPTFNSAILKQLHVESAQPRIANEFVCTTVTYRLWSITPRLSYWEISEKGKVTKWFPGDGVKKPIMCNGRGLVLVTYISAHLTQPAEFETALPETFGRKDREKIQGSVGYSNRNTFLVEADGIVQQPGYYDRKNISNSFPEYTALDTRPKQLNANGTFTTHTVPRYKDLSSVVIPEGANLLVYFYRLKDGYGVKEQLMSSYWGPTFQCGFYCDPTPEQTFWMTNGYTKYYRIHNGEAAYTEVTSLPVFEYPYYFYGPEFVVHDNAVYGLIPPPNGVRLHKIDQDRYETRDGVVINEDNVNQTVRYSLFDKTLGKIVQRWQAVIQK